jgi:hypothetical protein
VIAANVTRIVPALALTEIKARRNALMSTDDAGMTSCSASIESAKVTNVRHDA